MKGTANTTLKIIADGCYTSFSGKNVDLKADVANAVNGTVLYRPEDFSKIQTNPFTEGGNCMVEVTEETTAQASRRLFSEEGCRHVVALNFGSAKNPGGGFLGGAKAQEEDLARCSALYTCLLTQPTYYEANRKNPSLLYTDHIIYSPDVPFFRDDSLELIDVPFLVSIITAPAPNAGEVLRRDPSGEPHIRKTLERRAFNVLQIAAHKNHKILVLGAWGCGVFRNKPEAVAEIFSKHLKSDSFSGIFERVVFAIFDNSPNKGTLHAFEKHFK